MTDAVGTVIEKWAVERMQSRRIQAAVYPENIASQRVFTKNGFVEKWRVAAHSVVKGVARGLVMFEYVPVKRGQ